MDINVFIAAVHARFVELSKNELFVVGKEGEERRELEQVYLDAYPEGTNPIYKVRTEHDCSCCRHFIRALGSVVGLKDGQVLTIWDIPGLPYPFDIVAKALHEHVLSKPITGLFRTRMLAYGQDKNHQRLEDGTIKTWTHFHAPVAGRHRSDDIGKDHHNFDRQLKLLVKGFDLVTDEGIVKLGKLIEARAIDRVEHKRPTIAEFNALRKQYLEISDERARNLFAIETSVQKRAVADLINSALGELLQDLSGGEMATANAVNKYQLMVDPTNVHRSTSAVSEMQIVNAMEKIEELGLEPSTERRFANMGDVNINDVIWASGEAKDKMRSPLAATLLKVARAPEVKTDHASDLTVAEFMANVLPNASNVEVLVKNGMVNHLMSLTAPVHADAKNLFKWGNPIAWAYNGNFTDSIRERVKAAGGDVNAKLRVSLAWFNTDDLDIHCVTPDGEHIYFRNKAGVLDVDMNAGYAGNPVTNPVENLSWRTPKSGAYAIFVDNFQRRNNSDFGFTLELEVNGQVKQFHSTKAVEKQTTLRKPVFMFNYDNGAAPYVDKWALGEDLKEGQASREVWGIKTETFVPVQTVMLSPNYWNGQEIGHKHWFFILQGCKNDQPVRGINNEFLDSALYEHRKVFELIGEKTKCPVVDDQLSGIGFSTSREAVVVVKARVAGVDRMFNVQF